MTALTVEMFHGTEYEKQNYTLIINYFYICIIKLLKIVTHMLNVRSKYVMCVLRKRMRGSIVVIITNGRSGGCYSGLARESPRRAPAIRVVDVPAGALTVSPAHSGALNVSQCVPPSPLSPPSPLFRV